MKISPFFDFLFRYRYQSIPLNLFLRSYSGRIGSAIKISKNIINEVIIMNDKIAKEIVAILSVNAV